MTRTTASARAAATIALTVGATASLIAGPSEAHAAAAGVAPGDQIDAVAGDQQETCTLGYTFTDPASYTTYGITAGHCNLNNNSSYVQDRSTGTVGHFMLTVAEPDFFNGDDYGVINFGTTPSAPTMYGITVTGAGAPDPQNAVCHTGVKTGVTCGQLGKRLTRTQFTTTGMNQSIPGDSGGPVWQTTDQGTATVVGIWLGERITGNGTRSGRFSALPDIMTGIASKMKAM